MRDETPHAGFLASSDAYIRYIPADNVFSPFPHAPPLPWKAFCAFYPSAAIPRIPPPALQVPLWNRGFAAPPFPLLSAASDKPHAPLRGMNKPLRVLVNIFLVVGG